MLEQIEQQATAIKAGSYEVGRGITPLTTFMKMGQ